VAGQRYPTLRKGQALLDVRAARNEEAAHRERIDHLETLGALEPHREEVGNAPEVRLGLRFGQIEHGSDRDLDPPPGDPDAIVGLRDGFAIDRDVQRLGEAGLHGADLGVAEDFLVSSEWLTGDRVEELVPLAEDRELLADLRSPALADIQVEHAPLGGDHEAFQRAERLGEVVEHERERRPDAIGHPGSGARGGREHAQHDEADGGPYPRAQNVTDGLWIPKTPRRTSQISPRVAATST